jgi:hypothetical protein
LQFVLHFFVQGAFSQRRNLVCAGRREANSVGLTAINRKRLSAVVAHKGGAFSIRAAGEGGLDTQGVAEAVDVIPGGRELAGLIQALHQLAQLQGETIGGVGEA